MRKTLIILSIIFSLTIPAQSKTITNQKFNLHLQLPNDWISLPTAKNANRIFDLIRYYPQIDKKNINRKNIQEHIAARIFLKYEEQTSKKKLINFAQELVAILAITGFEQQSTATLVKTGTPHIHYTLLRKPLKQIGKNRDNTLWMSIRVFKMNKKFFIFMSMAKSKKELSEGRSIFQTLEVVK